MLGMAVDANVLIYERLREERDRGASLALAIRNGYDRAFPTIIDTHLTQHLHRHRALRGRQRSAQGLRHQPDGRPDHQPVHVAVHDPVDVRLLAGQGLAAQAEHVPAAFPQPNIDFMRIRYYWFTATIALTMIGLTVFLVRGPAGPEHRLRRRHGLRRPTQQAGEHRQTARAARAAKQQETRLAVQDVQGAAEDGHALPHHLCRHDTPQTVRFRNRVPGDTEQARDAVVKDRAKELPDWSVEQIFLTTGDETGAGPERQADSSPSAPPRRRRTWSRSRSTGCWSEDNRRVPAGEDRTRSSTTWARTGRRCISVSHASPGIPQGC